MLHLLSEDVNPRKFPLPRPSHYSWRNYTHHLQAANERPPHNRGRSQKKLLFRLIRFGEYVVLVVKVVELLRQLESILGGVGRLGGGDTLFDDVRKLSRTQPELPYLVVFFQEPRIDPAGENFFSVQVSFAKDVGGAHHRVLAIRAGFTFKA